ncbi:hypothetical protein CU097_003242, partial [Rhizopus azygosporus]
LGKLIYKEEWAITVLKLPDALKQLDKKRTLADMYRALKVAQANRYNDRDIYWVKESALNYIDLLYENDNISVHRVEFIR